MLDQPHSRRGLADRLAQACRVLGALELTPSTFGHASARLPGSEDILIRARGPAEAGVRYTRAIDIIRVDLDGRRRDGDDDGYRVPLEIHIHTEIYRRRPDVHAVVHAHTASAVLLTICGKDLLPIYGAYDPFGLQLAMTGVPTYPRSTLIRDPGAGAELATCLGSAPACLMRGHGLTTAANSIEEAALAVIHLDTLASMSERAHRMGGASVIPDEEQAEFAALDAADYGQARPGKPSGRAASLWAYYTRFADV